MKKYIRIISVLVLFLFCTTNMLNARNILDYTLIGLIRDKKSEKKPKTQDTNINIVQQIASYEGAPMTMQELLEQGIVLTPELIENLKSFGVDIPTKLDCNPFTDISDPLYEWGQFDNKLGSAKMTPNGLMLSCKAANLSALSVVDLNFDPKDIPFEFGLSFCKTPAQSNKYVGLILDFENNGKYKAIVFSQKDFIYYSTDEGKISVIKQGLVKPGKFIETIYVKLENSKLSVFLNGLEVTTLNRVTITSPISGVIVSGKRTAICNAFYFNVLDVDELNQSTTD